MHVQQIMENMSVSRDARLSNCIVDNSQFTVLLLQRRYQQVNLIATQ